MKKKKARKEGETTKERGPRKEEKGIYVGGSDDESIRTRGGPVFLEGAGGGRGLLKVGGGDSL